MSSSANGQQLLDEAREALQKGDYQLAIEDYKKLAAAAPKVAEIHANLGTVYFFSGQFDDAIRECRRALELKPAMAGPRYFLALSLAESGRCKEAMPGLERDYRSPEDPHLKRMAGVDAARCAMALGRPDDSVRLVQSLTREFPNDPDVLYLSSHVFSDLSTQASERLLAVAPDSYQAHRFNAEALETEGRLKEAIDEYRKVLEINPRLAEIHYEIGRLLLATAKDDADYEQAEAEFKRELEINPWSASAEYELGNFAWTKRDWESATQYFKRATELNSDMGTAWMGLGKSLSSAGKFQQAVQPLERAVKLNPNDPDGHYRLAFVLRRLGRDQQAEGELAAYRRAEQDQMNRMKKIRLGMTGPASQSPETPPRN